MPAQGPYFDLRLYIDKVCYLSNEHPFNITIFITPCSPHPVTIVKQHSILSRQVIIDQGLIEIMDSETGRKVQLLATNPPSVGQPPANDFASSLTTLDTRPTWIALTTDSNRKGGNHLPLDTTPLEPDRAYTVSLKVPHVITWWSSSSKDAVLAHAAQNDNNLPPTATPPITYRPTNTAHFITRPHLVQPPAITVSLSAPSSTYSVSSSLPFLFTLKFTSNFPRPLTVLAERPLTVSINSDIVILDALTSQRVGLDLIDLMDEGLWEEADFLRLVPGMPYLEERALELEGLEGGKEYILKFVEITWGWWGEEEVQDLLKVERSKDRSGDLPYVLPVKLVCDNNEVRFWAR